MPLPESVAERYSLNEVPLFVHIIQCRELYDFCKIFSELVRLVREADNSELLKDLRQFVWRVMFTFRNTPIPYSVLRQGDLKIRRLRLFEEAPHLANAGGQALIEAVKLTGEQLDSLGDLPNPLLRRFQEVFGENPPSRCIVAQKNWIPGLGITQLSKLTGLQLETPCEIESIESQGCYFGQISAYQYRLNESFLLAPSFREIHLIGFNSQRELQAILQSVSLDFLKTKESVFRPVRIEVKEHGTSATDITDENGVESSSIQIRQEIIDRLLRQLDTVTMAQGDDQDREVQASAFLVADGKILFLRENGHPKVLIPGTPSIITPRAVSEIDDGDIILQRSESANVRADFEEALHDEWKSQLSKHIEIGLIDEIRSKLKSEGFPQTPTTIRNWCEKSHGPADPLVFSILMDYLDLDRVDERWAIIQAFRELGHEAGFKATDDLCEKFLQLDQGEFSRIREGQIIEKSLGGRTDASASMYAVMIEGVFVPSLKVKQHLLGKVIPVPEDLIWQ